MHRISRRTFLKSATAAVGSGFIVPSLSPNGFAVGPLERRALGTTGLEVSLLGLGCVAIGYGSHSIEEGAEIVHACIDAGINYIDCASTYGNAELKVGEVMKTRRKEVVLATKTLQRSVEASWKEINRSLERLKTGSVDLLQIHAVNQFDDLDRITASDGSLNAALRAKDEGLAAHIGITGHTRPEVIGEALRRYPFETALVPLSSTDKLVNDFGDVLFPLARTGEFGIIAMKVLAAGRVTSHVRDSLRYALSLPISTAIVGMGTLEEVRQNVRIARRFRPMSSDEMIRLEETTRASATTAVLWWKRR